MSFLFNIEIICVTQEKIFIMVYLTERITSDPGMLGGKPAIRGMRMSVQTILEYLAAGETKENILKEFPFLEAEDIDACLDFAAKLMGKYSVHVLAA